MDDRLTDEELRGLLENAQRWPLITADQVKLDRIKGIAPDLAAEVLELRASVRELENRPRIGSHGAGTTI